VPKPEKHVLYTFSLPIKADKVPVGPGWLREVKYDGYRMMLIREQARERLISRGGHDWARRFPLIVTAALKLRQEHFVIDGETVVLGLDGVSDFGALHSGRHNERAQLYAFDMLAGDGEDQRQLPLSLCKINLARLLKRRTPGVFVRLRRALISLGHGSRYTRANQDAAAIVGSIEDYGGLVRLYCVAGLVEYATAMVPLPSVVVGDVAVGQR
jgi:ATP-dependent DNA ligase